MKNKGFTLVELLLVALIISLLASIAMPIITNSVDNIKMKADLETLNAAFETIKMQSRASETRIQISFYTNNPGSSFIHGYQFGTNLNPENPADGTARITKDKKFTSSASKIFIANSIRIIEFSPTSSVRYMDKDKALVAYQGPCLIGIGNTSTWNIEVFFNSGQSLIKFN